MLPGHRLSLWLTTWVMAIRLIPMALLPLTDTTEARYATIARLMVTKNDWITVWFTTDMPFWGKPPLAFWCEALSIKLFGANAFAVRLPSWLVTAASIALIYKLASHWYNQKVAALACLIFASTALVFVSSGAVMTDAFLCLGITLALTGVALVENPGRKGWWGYAFFLGLAIGLLAKGPLALVLTLPTIMLTALFSSEFRAQLAALPWLRGSALTLVLVCPWYIAAEIKTPGFLEYFIWGEHVLRFIDSGWSGDRYGNGHSHPFGFIWLYLFAACLPWSLVAIPAVFTGLKQPKITWQRITSDHELLFLWGWLLTTPLFFTVAGNVLWTYVLPSIPGFAILLAQVLSHAQRTTVTPSMPITNNPSEQRWTGGYVAAATLPCIAIVVSLLALLQQLPLRTEEDLVRTAQAQSNDPELWFIDRPVTYSARFYNNERVHEATLNQLLTQPRPSNPMWIVAKPSTLQKLAATPGIDVQEKNRNKRFAVALTHFDQQ